MDRFRANSDLGLQQVTESLCPYLTWQHAPRFHPVVYGHNTHAHHVCCWAVVRRGHHDFADGRSARHRNTCVGTFPPPYLLFPGGGVGRYVFFFLFPIGLNGRRGGVSFRKKSIIMFSFFLFQRSIVFTVRFLCFLATRKAEDS